MVAVVCDRELKAPRVLFEFMLVMDGSFGACVKLSAERALVWAIRLMLHYASPELTESVLPSDLTARAQGGCKRALDMTYSRPLRNEESSFDEWENTNFASLRAPWVYYGSVHDSL